MKSLLMALVGLLATVREIVLETYRRIPGNQAMDRVADLLTRPIRGLAGSALRTFPKLKRWEWLLEIERIRFQLVDPDAFSPIRLWK